MKYLWFREPLAGLQNKDRFHKIHVSWFTLQSWMTNGKKVVQIIVILWVQTVLEGTVWFPLQCPTGNRYFKRYFNIERKVQGHILLKKYHFLWDMILNEYSSPNAAHWNTVTVPKRKNIREKACTIDFTVPFRSHRQGEGISWYFLTIIVCIYIQMQVNLLLLLSRNENMSTNISDHKW